MLTFANRHFRRPVRIVGEPIWAGRSPAEIVEAIRHEALLNLAFAGTAVEVLCPSETNALAADVVSAARRTHPTIMSHGRYTVSPSYADPAVVTTTCDQVRLSEPATARTLLVTSATLPSVHARVAGFAARDGASAGRAADLASAVDEAVTAAFDHGSPRHHRPAMA